MDVLFSIVSHFLGPFWPYLAAAGAAVGGLFVAYFKGKSKARADLAAKQAAATAKATDKGRKAAGKAGEDLRSGKTPDDVVGRNDKKW